MTGRYQWLVVLTSAWLVAGGWIDAWAHHRTSVETFFTPWHAVLYSGFLASAAVVVSPAVLRFVRRSTESPALPPGYGLSVLGLLLFALAGAGDAVWHTILGIEEDIEALLSPPHLMLGAGAFLIVSGPARAAWRDLGEGAGSGWERLGPPLLSTAMVLSLATFLTAYANPLSIPLAAGDGITRLADFGLGSEDFVGSETLKQGLGVAGILVLAVLIAGASAVVLRWPRRFGAFTILLTVGLAPSLLPHQVVAFLPVVVGGGLGCDVLARLLRPAPARASHLLRPLLHSGGAQRRTGLDSRALAGLDHAGGFGRPPSRSPPCAVMARAPASPATDPAASALPRYDRFGAANSGRPYPTKWSGVMRMSFSRSHKGSRTIFEVLDASSRDLPSRIRGVLETVSGGFASRLGSRRVRGLGPGRRHPMIWGHAATLLVTVVIALACLAAAVRRWFVVELGPLGDNGVFPEDWQDTKNAAGWS